METIPLAMAISLFAPYCGDFVMFSSLLCLELETEGQLNVIKSRLSSLEIEWKEAVQKKDTVTTFSSKSLTCRGMTFH